MEKDIQFIKKIMTKLVDKEYKKLRKKHKEKFFKNMQDITTMLSLKNKEEILFNIKCNFLKSSLINGFPVKLKEIIYMYPLLNNDTFKELWDKEKDNLDLQNEDTLKYIYEFLNENYEY